MKIVAKVRKLLKEGRIEGAKNLIKSNKEIIPLDERKKLKKELMKYLKTKMVAEIFNKEEDVSSSSGEETAKLIESIRDVDDSSSEQEEAPVKLPAPNKIFSEDSEEEEVLHTCMEGDIVNCIRCMEQDERDRKEKEEIENSKDEEERPAKKHKYDADDEREK